MKTKDEFRNSPLLDGHIEPSYHTCGHCGKRIKTSTELKRHVHRYHWEEIFPETPLKGLRQQGYTWSQQAYKLGVSVRYIVLVASGERSGSNKFWSRVNEWCQAIYQPQPQPQPVMKVVPFNYCPDCGRDLKIIERANFCPECGLELRAVDIVVKQ